MNMNKKIFMFVIALLSLFLFNINASAVNCGDIDNQKDCMDYEKCMWSPPMEAQSNSNYCSCNSSSGSCSKSDIKECNINKTKNSCINSKCAWTQYCVDNPSYKPSEGATGDEKRKNSYWNKDTTTTKAPSNTKCPDGYTLKDGITCVLDKKENVASKPCQEDDVKKVFRLFGYVLMIAKICIPLIIIIMGTFDLFKAVYGQDDKALGKQLRILVWRIVGGLTIFFLPTIVGAFFKISSDIDVTEKEDYKICANCLLDPLNKQICSVNENEYDSNNNNVSKITSTTTTTKRVHGGKGGSY